MKYAGVYRIFNIITEKLYVGSSNKVKTRIIQHKSDLRNNKHSNKFLQASWNLHGETAFIFETLELVNDVDNLIEHEQYWLDLTRSYDRNIGYNLNKIADRPTGLKQSDEHKLRIKLANTGRLFSDEAGQTDGTFREWF